MTGQKDPILSGQRAAAAEDLIFMIDFSLLPSHAPWLVPFRLIVKAAFTLLALVAAPPALLDPA